MDYTGLKKICDATHVPICVYKSLTLDFRCPDKESYYFYSGTEENGLQRLYATLREKGEPILFFEDAHIWYGAFLSGAYIVILGPTVHEGTDYSIVRAFRERHSLPADFVLPKISGRRLRAALSLAWYALTGLDYNADDFQLANIHDTVLRWDVEADMEHYELDQSETERDHDSMAYEKEIYRAVREGDTEAIKNYIKYAKPIGEEHIGVLAKEPRKQTEYMCVTLIAILARVATEGGLNQEKAYSLSDVYLQKIAASKTEEEMLALAARAQYEFTLKVHESKKRDSGRHYVEACKAYIHDNLRRPLQVGAIADALGLNRSYLTRKFSEAEGMSIHDYITRERCAHAANLLRSSDYSIAMIAEYFCFSSQSHFGQVFKEYSGMTPTEYRNKHKR